MLNPQRPGAEHGPYFAGLKLKKLGPARIVVRYQDSTGWQLVYSHRRASIGSTRAARRAGINAASNAMPTIATTPKAIGATLFRGRSWIKFGAKALPHSARGAPTASPAQTRL